MIFEHRILLRREADVLGFVENHVAAFIGLGDPGADVLALGVGGRVHMGDEADGGRLRRGRHRAVDIAVVIHMGIGNAHGLHVLHNGLGQRQLPRRGGAGGGFFIGRGGIGHQLKKLCC